MQQNKQPRTGQKNILKKAARMLLSAAVWLAVWQIAFLLIHNDILFASPAAVFTRLWELIQTGSFWLKTGHSVLGVMEGYCLGVLAGTVLAVLTASSRLLYLLFRPVLSVIKATPVVSFIILALVWMQKNTVPVFISFLMVLPIIWANLSMAIRQTDRDLLEMGRSYGLGPWKLIRKIYVPSVIPAFLTALTTAIGFAWKSGIAAEVISTPRDTIGTALNDSKVYLETTDLFAWTIAVILLSILFEKLIVWGIGKITKSAGGKS